MTLIKSKVKEMPNSKEDGEWQCSKCGKRLTSKRNLQNHKDKKNNCNKPVIATVHPGQRPFWDVLFSDILIVYCLTAADHCPFAAVLPPT